MLLFLSVTLILDFFLDCYNFWIFILSQNMTFPECYTYFRFLGMLQFFLDFYTFPESYFPECYTYFRFLRMLQIFGFLYFSECYLPGVLHLFWIFGMLQILEITFLGFFIYFLECYFLELLHLFRINNF